MKKRLLSWFLALVMVLGLLPMTAWAEEEESATESITVNVTIANKGELEIAHEAVTVVDQNKSGTFDIDDALYAAHEECYTNGAASGYSTYTGQYGLAIGTLWGDNSGNFLYYVNNASANGLTDLVNNGDKVVAFILQDGTKWSDAYSYFDQDYIKVTTGEKIQLTLSAYVNWSLSVLKNAIITVDGTKIEAVTDEDGKTEISFDEAGTYLVSATHETMILVPPVCVVTVTEEQESGSGTENEGSGEVGGEEDTNNDETKGDDEEDIDQDKISVEIKTLMENIAASYVDNSNEWVIMDMAAYKDLDQANYDGLDLKDFYTSDKAKQKYINEAIKSITAEVVGDTTYDKAILSLTAIGIDAEKLYAKESETSISVIDGLNSVNQSTSIWNAPYTLMAYGQNEYVSEETYTETLLSAVLDSQNDNGSWGGGSWDNGIQSTANMIAALAFYNDEDGVEEAIDSAVDFLALSQNEDGKFYDYADNDGTPYADGNTAAIVVIGLCAAGINPDTNEDFVKGEVSALDALMGFVREDKTGFYWRPGHSLDATEQAFRALIAASQIVETGEAFNIYDFSHNAGSLVPGYAVEVEEENTPDRPSHRDDDITVEVSIKAIDEYWMRNKDVTIDEDSTVYDAFMEAIDGSDIEQEGAEEGYIESMTKDGETLGEFDYGDNSGWMYEVNDERPDVGIRSYELEDGDEILFYYVEDWTEDEDADSRDQDKEEEVKEEEIQEELKEEPVEEEPVEKIPVGAIFTDITEENAYYDAVQWAVDHKITSGVTETVFGADGACSRGQMITFLWRMMGSPAPETKVAPYIDVVAENYYHDAILWATENDFANGTDGISFRPEMTLTRGQAVAFLWRAAGMPEPVGENSFVDISETEYYYKAVLWAAENGITFGTGDNGFSPDVPCTRGQIVTFLYRYFGK